MAAEFLWRGRCRLPPGRVPDRYSTWRWPGFPASGVGQALHRLLIVWRWPGSLPASQHLALARLSTGFHRLALARHNCVSVSSSEHRLKNAERLLTSTHPTLPSLRETPDPSPLRVSLQRLHRRILVCPPER